jgi:hypothetical protein
LFEGSTVGVCNLDAMAQDQVTLANALSRHLASIAHGVPDSLCTIRQFDPLMVDRLNVVVEVKKVPWHRMLPPYFIPRTCAFNSSQALNPARGIGVPLSVWRATARNLRGGPGLVHGQAFSATGRLQTWDIANQAIL